MLVLSEARFAGCWFSRGGAAAGLLLALLGLMGCRSERSAGAAEREIVTRVEMVRPAAERVRSEETTLTTAPPAAAPSATGNTLAAQDSVEETAEYCKK